MAYPAPPGDNGQPASGQSGTGQDLPPGQTPGSSGSGNDDGSGSSLSNIPKLVLVGALLLVLLLLLANHFPKFTTGFMLLVLTGVVVTHSSIITSFFNTNG